MAGKKRYYVVWQGRHPGVYDDYSDVLEQVDGYPGARFKGFGSAAEAAEAYRRGLQSGEERSLGTLLRHSAAAAASRQADTLLSLDALKRRFPEIDPGAWAVDASCLGNPGVMEYQCVALADGRRVFHFGPVDRATNNIGEFLGLVHALALMERSGEWHTIYSDSRTAMAWVRNRKANTKLTAPRGNPAVLALLARAEQWLRTHRIQCRILKWQTELWGEIPADFGRK